MSRNNWLSLNLPDNVRSDLEAVAQYVCTNAATVFGDDTITFKPMALDDVHITAVFIGDGLHRLKYQALSDFHSHLPGLGSGEYQLQFSEFSLFPPDKNNLIVAKFTADKKLFQVCDSIATHGEKFYGKETNIDSNILERFNSLQINLLGATREQVAKLVKNGLAMPPLGQNAMLFNTDGVYLCGSAPPQGYFDWKIIFDGK